MKTALQRLTIFYLLLFAIFAPVFAGKETEATEKKYSTKYFKSIFKFAEEKKDTITNLPIDDLKPDVLLCTIAIKLGADLEKSYKSKVQLSFLFADLFFAAKQKFKSSDENERKSFSLLLSSIDAAHLLFMPQSTVKERKVNKLKRVFINCMNFVGVKAKKRYEQIVDDPLQGSSNEKKKYFEVFFQGASILCRALFPKIGKRRVFIDDVEPVDFEKVQNYTQQLLIALSYKKGGWQKTKYEDCLNSATGKGVCQEKSCIHCLKSIVTSTLKIILGYASADTKLVGKMKIVEESSKHMQIFQLLNDPSKYKYNNSLIQKKEENASLENFTASPVLLLKQDEEKVVIDEKAINVEQPREELASSSVSFVKTPRDINQNSSTELSIIGNTFFPRVGAQPQTFSSLAGSYSPVVKNYGETDFCKYKKYPYKGLYGAKGVKYNFNTKKKPKNLSIGHHRSKLEKIDYFRDMAIDLRELNAQSPFIPDEKNLYPFVQDRGQALSNVIEKNRANYLLQDKFNEGVLYRGNNLDSVIDSVEIEEPTASKIYFESGNSRGAKQAQKKVSLKWALFPFWVRELFSK